MGDGRVAAHLSVPPGHDGVDDAREITRDRPVDPLPVVRDGRVRTRHVERVHGDGAEADREVRGELRVDPERMSRLDDLPRPDDLGQLGVDRVVGVDHRVPQVDPTEVGAFVVRDRPDAVAGIDLHRLGVELRRGGDPAPERAGEHDRLEGRAWLALRLGREVELAPPVVRPAEHRLDGSAARVDRDECGSRAARVAEDLLDRLARLRLEVEVDGRRHLEAAAEDPFRAVLPDELVGHVVDEVRGGPACAGQMDVVGLREGCGVRLAQLASRDPALVEQELEDVRASLPSRGGMLDRVVEGRAPRKPREQRGLRQRQLGRVLVEVRPRSLEDSVRAVAEVDRVEVRGEDPVLRPALRQLPRERGLADLSREGVLVAAVRVLDVLLRDRRAALDHALTSDVLPERAEDAVHVDTLVLVEALVLDRHDRLLHDRRDLVRGDEDAALVAAQDREHAPLPRGVRGRVDHRVDVAVRARRIECRELGADRDDQAVAERRPGQREQRQDQYREPQLPYPAAPRRRLRPSSKPQNAVDCSPAAGIFRPVRATREARRRSARPSPARGP